MQVGPAPVHRGPGFRAFLFSDLRGYTAYIEAHGDAAGARLLERYRGVVRAVIVGHEGAEIRTEGDSFYVIFPSASKAVAAGLEIVAGAARQEADTSSAPIRVGVGIHAGETEETAEGPVGSAINVAARICAAARPGEVLVSDTIRSLVRTSSAITFVSRGRPSLKGVTEPIELFAALDPVAAPATGRVPGRVLRSRRVPGRIAFVLGLLAFTVPMAAILVANAPQRGVGGPGSPSASPVASAATQGTASAVTASAGSGGFPDKAEADLLALLPPLLAPRCTRAVPGNGSLGGEASLLCELSASDADTVWFDRLSGKGVVTERFERLVGEAGAPTGTCDEKHSSANGEWRYGSTFGGQMLCYQAGGRSWIVWTYPDSRIVAQAVRGDADFAALYRWWKTVGPFLR
jgi:class 3 adenylate cyclase